MKISVLPDPVGKTTRFLIIFFLCYFQDFQESLVDMVSISFLRMVIPFLVFFRHN